jgi:hypothetical protein
MSTKPPTLKASPRPDAPEFSEHELDNADPDSVITGVHPATRDFVREVSKSGLFKTAWALLATAAALVAGTLWAYRAAAQEARDAGTSAATDVKRQADATQRELERFQVEVSNRLTGVEQAGNRTEQKVDRLLYRFDIPNPAPAPKDGGR